MKYITGMHALNLLCSLNTCGDWHTSALTWDTECIDIRESEDTLFKNYGIEDNRVIPEHLEKYHAANHIRAILDLMECGNIGALQGFREDYISNDDYTNEVFNMVIKLTGNKNWEQIDKLLGREYKMEWIRFKYSIGVEKKNDTIGWYEVQCDWRIKHRDVMGLFTQHLNSVSNSYILKDGTALMFCYGLDRFSEDIDLDGSDTSIFEIVSRFCEDAGFKMTVNKNTDTVKRCIVHYGGIKPLKIEASYRNMRSGLAGSTSIINGILVYNISKLLEMKSVAYSCRDKIRDLYDIVFICNAFWDCIDKRVIEGLSIALSYKGIEQLEYLIETQQDPLINTEILTDGFLKLWFKLGLA